MTVSVATKMTVTEEKWNIVENSEWDMCKILIHLRLAVAVAEEKSGKCALEETL